MDESLIGIIARRSRTTREIGRLKKLENFPPVDAEKEKQQTKRIKELTKMSGVSEHVAVKTLRAIIDEVVNDHRSIQPDDGLKARMADRKRKFAYRDGSSY